MQKIAFTALILCILTKKLYICSDINRRLVDGCLLTSASKTQNAMTATEQTYQQIERALRKVASKFPQEAENMPLTDIYLQVLQDSGEIRVYDDDDNELTRCVVEEWIGNTDENFYTAVQPILTDAIKRIKDVTENVAVLKPYSYVLIGEDRETIADIYLVDDENIVISGELMKGLNEDLENFWEDLAKYDVL